jgi:hypothetical protein
MIFKNMKAHHASSLLRDGVLRIGTLYEFRDVEKHGTVIGDDEEGVKRRYSRLNGRYTNETATEIVKKFIDIGPGADVSLEDCTFTDQEESPDCYMFCATQEYSAKVMAQFNADTCIAIENEQEFYKALTRAINRETGNKNRFWGQHRCTYTSRNVKYEEDHGIPGALIKGKKYEEQKEVRAIWQPPSNTIQPVIIKCPEVRSLLSVFPKKLGCI